MKKIRKNGRRRSIRSLCPPWFVTDGTYYMPVNLGMLRRNPELWANAPALTAHIRLLMLAWEAQPPCVISASLDIPAAVGVSRDDFENNKDLILSGFCMDGDDYVHTEMLNIALNYEKKRIAARERSEKGNAIRYGYAYDTDRNKERMLVIQEIQSAIAT